MPAPNRTIEMQAAFTAHERARREDFRAYLKTVYEDRGLVQQTTFDSPNHKMDQTYLGPNVRYGTWCRKEAERIRAAPGRRAEVLTYPDGKVALFVDNCTGGKPSFGDED